jgi:hypothetical protein
LPATAAQAADYFPSYARADFSGTARAVAKDNLCDALLVRGPLGEFPGATLVLCLVLGVGLFFGRAPNTRLLALAASLCALAVVTQAYVCYHGDAMETERHGMMIGTLLRLDAILAALAVVSWLEQRTRAA